MRGMSGSGPLGVEAQMVWLGQEAQAESLPARLEVGPGQCSGSGAMRGGGFLRGAERSIWREGSMAVVVVVVVVDGMMCSGSGMACSLDGLLMIFLEE